MNLLIYKRKSVTNSYSLFHASLNILLIVVVRVVTVRKGGGVFLFGWMSSTLGMQKSYFGCKKGRRDGRKLVAEERIIL